MINFLSKWIEGIAISVIIVSIFEMILPQGNLKKYIKIILGIYVVFSIIAPFVNAKELYSFDLTDTLEKYGTENTFQKNSTNDLNNIYISSFEKEIIKKIEKEGYEVYKCTVDAVFNADEDDLGINSIKIVLDSKKYKEDDEEVNEDNEKINNVENIEKVEINLNDKQDIENETDKITEEDMQDLKEILSNYYEIEENIINIQAR